MLFPGHRYLGPGNPIDNGPPVDSDDEIARQHDLKYEQAQNKGDIRQADTEAIFAFSKDLVQNRNWHSGVGALGLGAKYLAESVVGVQYPRDLPDGVVQLPKRPRSPEIFFLEPSGKRTKIPESQFWHLFDPAFVRMLNDGEIEPPASGSGSGGGGNDGVQADQASGGPSGQHGPGKSTMGGGSPIAPIYIGLPQRPNKCTLSYRKSYHFYMMSSLPSLAKGKDEAYMKYFPGGCHDIPWNYLFCYVSPREANFLRTQFTEVRALEAKCMLSSLGVRLPFETNASNSVTANANAQYPVCLFGDLDKHYFTETQADNIDKLRTQMIGADLYTLTDQDTDHTAFPNLSAQACSRKFVNPLGILYPRPHRKNVDKNIVDALQQHPAEPQIYQFATMVNGSNYLGPLFHKTYRPKNGLLFSRNTLQTITKPAGTLPDCQSVIHGPSRLPLVAYHDVDFFHEGGESSKFTAGDYIPAC